MCVNHFSVFEKKFKKKENHVENKKSCQKIMSHSSNCHENCQHSNHCHHEDKVILNFKILQITIFYKFTFIFAIALWCLGFNNFFFGWTIVGKARIAIVRVANDALRDVTAEVVVIILMAFLFEVLTCQLGCGVRVQPDAIETSWNFKNYLFLRWSQIL